MGVLFRINFKKKSMLTSGVSFSLLSADSFVQMATKPMNIVSQEMKMANPDMERVNRAVDYGTQELEFSQEALKQLNQREQVTVIKDAPKIYTKDIY